MSEPEKKITREDLYRMVWARPIVRLAGELGYTYPELAAICRDLNIPRPSGGYWYRLAHGGAEAQAELPPTTPGKPAEIPFGPRLSKVEAPATVAAEARLESESTEASEDQIDDTPKHASVKAPKEEQAARKVEAKPRLLEPEEAAEVKVLDQLRQKPTFDFWREDVETTVYPSALVSWLRLGDECRVSEARLIRAVKGVRKEYRSFQIEVREVREEYYRDTPALRVKIRLRDGCEWREAWEEAWGFAEKPNLHGLSDNGLRLYEWAKGPKNNGKITEQRRIGAQARLRGTYSHIVEHLREIRAKADANIQWEQKESGWQSDLRVWFEEQKVSYYHHGPLNPALGLNVVEAGHEDWERLRNWFYSEILKPGFPDGREIIGLFNLHDRKTLIGVFSRIPEGGGRWGPLPDFFNELRLMEGIEVRHRFDSGPGPWMVVCQLAKEVTWKIIKERLTAKANEIPLEKRYTLSADSQALLRWILELRSEEYLLRMTPPVEDELNKDIGIEVEWEEENLRAYLELLVEEINENTEFQLRTVSWRQHNDVVTRILVKKKEDGVDGIVRAIQALGLRQGKLLGGDELRAAISGLLGREN